MTSYGYQGILADYIKRIKKGEKNTHQGLDTRLQPLLLSLGVVIVMMGPELAVVMILTC